MTEKSALSSCEVRVFLFRVERQLADWPEKAEREAKWFEADEAAILVQEGGLAEIIRLFQAPMCGSLFTRNRSKSRSYRLPSRIFP